jgi:hypothetical protein
MGRVGALVFLLLLLALGAACDGEEVTEYQVTVGFNETVTQPDMDAVRTFLAQYDEDLEFLIQESFPPTGVAYVETDAPDFCAEVEAELTGETYVRDVACGERPEPSDGDPEEPVSSTPEATAS